MTERTTEEIVAEYQALRRKDGPVPDDDWPKFCDNLISIAGLFKTAIMEERWNDANDYIADIIFIAKDGNEATLHFVDCWDCRDTCDDNCLCDCHEDEE